MEPKKRKALDPKKLLEKGGSKKEGREMTNGETEISPLSV